MRHRRVGDALKEVDALDHRREELMGPRGPLRFGRLAPPDGEVQAIDLLPHLRADLFADLAGLLARGADARRNGLAIGEVDVRPVERIGACRRGPRRWRRQALEQSSPMPRRIARRPIERQIEIDVDRPRDVLGALEITAGPLQTVGDPRQHAHKCRLPRHRQRRRVVVEHPRVLLPPPCDELTTSDPLRKATRVSPPGTITTLSPDRLYGRRSTCRDSITPSMKHGAAESASVGCAM
jgi:hypothetical protein